ncbi:MAG: acetamidase/formamidase family protein, partial [Xanthobacteraceae bacterium]|nr:acetamidase/formamidase family protein [Xanthobacteraceae bacterium]
MMVRLEAGAGTVHWGYLDAALPAVATVDSGDVVTISTVSGPPEVLPPPPAIVPQALHDIHNAKARRMLPGHMCTGPVAVRGARPGQVLQIDIEDVALHY